MNNTEREYQRALIAAIESEMGARRISRSKLARLTGMALGTLDKTFWLQRDMSVGELVIIAEALDVTPEYIAELGRDWRARLDPASEEIISSADLSPERKQAIRDQLPTLSSGADTDAPHVKSRSQRRPG